jgi:tetratricopeptide (TPR) repeat protein
MTRRLSILVLVIFGLIGADVLADEPEAPPRSSDGRSPRRQLGPPAVGPSRSRDDRHEGSDRRDDRSHRGRTILIVPPWYWSRHRYESLYLQPQLHDYPSYSPYFYYSYYGPTYVPDYRGYVILNTPTAPEQPQAAEPQAGAPVLREAPRPREEAAFESKLSPMFGGPDRVGAAFALGEARLQAGEFEEAVAAFQDARASDPEGPLPQAGLGLALMGAERYAGAAHMLRRALAAVTDWAGIQPDLLQALGGREQYARVSARLQRAAEGNPADADLQFLLGFHYFGTGQYAKAANVLLPLHRADASEPAATGLLLAAEGRLGDEGKQAEEAPGGSTEGQPRPAPSGGAKGQAAPDHPG